MEVADCVALVTGAGSQRGIGRAFTKELCRRGAATVYAADLVKPSFDASSPGAERIEPLALDVTDAAAVAAAAAHCGNVDLLVNNAGVCHPAQLLGAPDLGAARREMEVNFWGMLMMCRAFAPVLERNGGGAIVIISSIYGLVNYPYVGSYSVSKAASASMIQGVRAELAGRGTHVVGVYPGTIDTDLSASNPSPNKTSPQALASAVLDALARGDEDVYYGQDAIEFMKRFASEPKALEREYAAKLKERLSARAAPLR